MGVLDSHRVGLVTEKINEKKFTLSAWEFPGGSVVRTWHFPGPGSIPGAERGQTNKRAFSYTLDLPRTEREPGRRYNSC